jgi:hypothetical protein
MKIRKITALLITAGLVLASLTACGDNSNNDDYVDWNNQQRENQSTDNTSENDNTDVETLPASILPRYEQAINNRDVQALIDCYDPEFIAFMQGVLNIGGSIGGAGSLGDNLGLMMPYLIRGILSENAHITVSLKEVSTDMDSENRATVVYEETLIEHGERTTSEQSMIVRRINGVWYIEEHGGIAPPTAQPDTSQYPVNPEEDFGFRNVDGGVEIISYEGGAIMHIPDTIAGQPVVSIGEAVLIKQGGFDFNDYVTTVIIPNSVRTISENAFRDSRQLRSIILGSGVTSIGSRAFASCGQLTGEIVIPNSVTYLGEMAFRYAKITSVVIGNGLTEIDVGVFWECLYLERVTIGNNVTSIGERAFWECRALKSVVIPDSVTTIGDTAFAVTNRNSAIIQGGGLISVTIANGVTSIGNSAFAGTSIENVVIPNSVTSIGEGAFSGTNLTSIIIPDSVTHIGIGAFAQCKELTSVTLGNGLTTVLSWFVGCSALRTIEVPDNVTSVCLSAFLFGGVTRITYRGVTYGNVDDFKDFLRGSELGGCRYDDCTWCT